MSGILATLGFGGLSVVGAVVALGLFFAYLCIVSAIFMVCYNRIYSRSETVSEGQKLNLWDAMAYVVILSMIGFMVFKSTNVLQIVNLDKIKGFIKN